MQSLKQLLELIEHKHQLDLKRENPKYLDPQWLLDSIAEELEEVRKEIKPNNLPHLEDELCDIFWGWLTLVQKLEKQEYIGSYESIIQRTLTKYEERILPLEGNNNDHAIWQEVKAKQKEALKREKEKRYNHPDL